MRTITLQELENEFGLIAVRATTLEPFTRAAGLMYLSEVKDRFARSVGPDNQPWTPLSYSRPQGGSSPLRNTGLFSMSFSAYHTSNSFGVGTNAIQANLMHHGGTVVPKSKRYLTIPQTKDAIYAGSARAMPGLFFVRRPQFAYLARREGGSVRIHWLLVTKVTIPARPIVGVSAPFLDRVKVALVNYLRTGSL